MSIGIGGPSALDVQITAHRDRVLIDQRLADVRCLLTLQIDRHIDEHSPDAPVPSSAKWLIIPRRRISPCGIRSAGKRGWVYPLAPGIRLVRPAFPG